MNTLLVSGTVADEQKALLQRLDKSGLSRPVHVHCGVQWGAGTDLGVSFFKPGKRSSDPALRTIYDSSPKRIFLICVSHRAVTSDVALVVTVAHELEHLRQENRCKGLLNAGNIAIEFVAANRAQFPTLTTVIHVPVNAHAEWAAAHEAIRLLGQPAVRAYYANDRSDLQDILTGAYEPENAGGDLRAFFRASWIAFESWACKTNRRYVDTIRRFLAS